MQGVKENVHYLEEALVEVMEEALEEAQEEALEELQQQVQLHVEEHFVELHQRKAFPMMLLKFGGT